MWNGKAISMMFVQLIFGLSFYGAMTIMTPFFLEELKYSEADTMMIIGAFASLGALFAIAGGFLGDKVIGEYRSVLTAYSMFVLGFGAIGFSAATLNPTWCLLGIALIICGRGLNSTNYSTLFRSVFDDHEAFEKAFTLNYSINNVGAMLATYGFPFLVGFVAYKGSFGLATLLCFLAVACLLFYRKAILQNAKDIDKNKLIKKSLGIFVAAAIAMIALVFFMFKFVAISKYVVYVISFLAVAYFISLILKSNKDDKARMLSISLTLLLTIGFFIYYSQLLTSLNVLAINTMRGDLFGIIPLKPEHNMMMNPLWCIVAGPVIAYIFAKLEKRNIYIFTANKIAIAFVLTAIAFGILTIGVKNIGSNLILSPELFLLVNLFQSFAEVIVGSLAITFIIEIAPKQHSSFSVSMYMVATSLSGMLGAIFSTYVALPEGQTLTQDFVVATYGNFFATLTALAVVMVLVAVGFAFLMKKWLKNANALETQAV